MKREKKIKIYCDKQTMVLGVIWTTVSIISCLAFTILTSVGLIETTNDTAFIIFWGLLGIACILSSVLTMPRWAAYITLDKNGIYFHSPFHKKSFQPYSLNSYIYRAKYFHGSAVGLGYYRDFIVISQKRLTNDELEHINNVGVSKEVIKIKYSKRNMLALKSVLPDKLYRTIEMKFSTGA